MDETCFHRIPLQPFFFFSSFIVEPGSCQPLRASHNIPQRDAAQPAPSPDIDPADSHGSFCATNGEVQERLADSCSAAELLLFRTGRILQSGRSQGRNLRRAALWQPTTAQLAVGELAATTRATFHNEEAVHKRCGWLGVGGWGSRPPRPELNNCVCLIVHTNSTARAVTSMLHPPTAHFLWSSTETLPTVELRTNKPPRLQQAVLLTAARLHWVTRPSQQKRYTGGTIKPHA